MYSIIIDGEKQRFVIEDEHDTKIANVVMGFRQWPNPGLEFLMSKAENRIVFERVNDLVDAANRQLSGNGCVTR